MADSSVDDPKIIVNPPPQPLFSLRRLAIVGLLGVAVLVLVLAFQRSPSSDGGTGCVNPVVLQFDPCPGSRILRQAQVGVELKQGYDGRISVNGIAVPEDQMFGAILPGTPAYDQLSAADRQLGPRPNNKNVVKFQPGTGLVVTRFSGQVSVAISYWKLTDGPDTAQTFNYTVFVT